VAVGAGARAEHADQIVADDVVAAHPAWHAVVPSDEFAALRLLLDHLPLKKGAPRRVR
jgi:hypothetical protein